VDESQEICQVYNFPLPPQTEDSEYSELQKMLDNDEEEEMSESDGDQKGLIGSLKVIFSYHISVSENGEYDPV
jgi:hypothetical protein